MKIIETKLVYFKIYSVQNKSMIKVISLAKYLYSLK